MACVSDALGQISGYSGDILQQEGDLCGVKVISTTEWWFAGTWTFQILNSIDD